MFVELVSATPNPMATCSLAAGCCYGREEESVRRLVNCMKSGHLSIFEHASATWAIHGISRACSHQLVRHRLASYSQQSQRYVKLDVSDFDWYVMPCDVEPKEYTDVHMELSGRYNRLMREAGKLYSDMIELGIAPEDARYVLPNACKTDIYVTMNFREFMHFLDMRLDRRAQWEIRELAYLMADELAMHSGDWMALIRMYEQNSEYTILNATSE